MAHVLFVVQAWESLGVQALSAYLKERRHRVSLLLDPALFAEPGAIFQPRLARLLDRREAIATQAAALAPDLLAFSVLTDSLPWALDMATRIRAKVDVPTIFGGVHPTSVPERVLEHPCVDFACVGEGEAPLAALLERLTRGGSEPIPGIWERREGALLPATPAPLLDPGSLPFPDKAIFHEASPQFRYGYTTMTARGCPRACPYCHNDLLARLYPDAERVRRRPVEQVIGELVQARARWSPRFVHFLDDVFVRDPAWLHPLLERYRERVGLPFFAFATASAIDEDTAQRLAEAGCYKVQLGVQCADEAYRREVLRRGESDASIRRAIRLLKARGIYVTCDNILGLPGLDTDDAEALLRFYAEEPADHHEVFWLRYYPRTSIVELARRQGILDEAEVERLERAEDGRGIARGGDSLHPARSRAQLMLALLPLLPTPVRHRAVRGRWHRLLPPLPPMGITVATRLANRAPWDLWTGRTLRRYAHFTLGPGRTAPRGDRA